MLTYIVFKVTGSRAATIVVGAAALTWSLFMALSRLHLGAHFTSDVVGGLMLGLAWTAACIAGVESARGRSVDRQGD